MTEVSSGRDNDSRIAAHPSLSSRPARRLATTGRKRFRTAQLAYDSQRRLLEMMTQAKSHWRWRERAARLSWLASVPLRRPGCLVLSYHRVSTADDPFPHLDVAEFRRQLRWLGRHCDVIAPDALVRAAATASASRPPVLLTFDDGYRSYHDVVCPVLRAFGMPAVAFVISDYADRPRPLPWDRLYLAVTRARVPTVTLPWRPHQPIHLDRPDRGEVIGACQRHFGTVPAEERARLLETLIAALDPEPGTHDRQTMTWDEVRATRDVTTLGAHSHTHPPFSTLDDGAIDDELRLSAARLTAETGVRPTMFAYPHGDVALRAKARLAAHGFNTAFSTAPGVNDGTTDWLEARRVGVTHVVPTGWMATRSWTPTPQFSSRFRALRSAVPSGR
jgi:peptidoglycan/xylan/chitin deacetylase (PgdA/CDA1 family)